MTMRETLGLMAILQEAYPRYYAGKTPEQAKSAAVLWQSLFADDAAPDVLAAVKAFIATDCKGFPPVIGQIKDRLVRIQNPDMLDEAQAWAMVSKAIQKSGYHAAEEYGKLPPVIQRVLGSPSTLKAWAAVDKDSLQTVVASNFQRAYRARAQDAKEHLALPDDVRRRIESSTSGVRCLEEEAPDPNEQKRRAIALLASERDAKQREILGDKYSVCKREGWMHEI